MNKKIILLILSVISLTSCSQSDEPKKIKRKIQNEFKSEKKVLGDHEYLMLVDIPGMTVPDRCAIYVNEKTGTSNLTCQDLSAPLIPIDPPEPEHNRN